MVAIGIATIPAFIRVTRAGALSVLASDYVLAARASGTPVPAIAVRHVLPNVAHLIGVQASVSFAMAILAEAALSYLGLGTPPTVPSWGRMLGDAQTYLFSHPAAGGLAGPRDRRRRAGLQHGRRRVARLPRPEAAGGRLMLQIRELSVAFGRRPPVVRGLDLDLDAGQRLGIIGESGSGKTVTALAIMGLLPEYARVTGSIRLDGTELVGLSDREMSRLRGDALSMIFQEPMTALDPTMTAGRQVAEAFRLHRDRDAGRARTAVLDMLAAVGFDDPDRIADSYPHQLSGGQRQRVDDPRWRSATGPEGW